MCMCTLFCVRVGVGRHRRFFSGWLLGRASGGAEGPRIRVQGAADDENFRLSEQGTAADISPRFRAFQGENIVSIRMVRKLIHPLVFEPSKVGTLFQFVSLQSLSIPLFSNLPKWEHFFNLFYEKAHTPYIPSFSGLPRWIFFFKSCFLKAYLSPRF